MSEISDKWIIEHIRAMPMPERVALADCTLAYCSICHECHPARFVHAVYGVFHDTRTVCNGCWVWLLYEAQRLERVAEVEP